MKLFIKIALIMLVVLSFKQPALSQQPSWMPTSNFSDPGALNVYSLGTNYGWCDRITVGGYSNTGNYPMFHSNDRGNTWTNIGPTPIGTVYSLAQESSTLGTKYAAIRDHITPSNSGLFRHDNTNEWQLRCCGGKEVRAVIQNTGTVLCGVSGSGRGIYRSTNMGDNFSQIYSSADIYCFWAQQNTFWAGGSYTSGTGVIIKSIGFPFDNWIELGTVGGYVIGLTVADNGNIFAATHQGNIYRSINGGPFEICRTGISLDILKIPIVATGNGTVFYGDYQTGVFYSSDNGTTWIEYNEGLTLPAHIIDLAIDPCDKNFVYMALGGSLSNHVYYREDFVISTSSNPTDGGTTSGGGTYSYNQTATITATPSAGWYFDSWTENGNTVSTDSIYSFTVTANRNLVANFTPILYLISTFVNPSGSGYTTGAGNYSYGEVATVEAFPYPQWEFQYWTENGDTVSTDSIYSFTVTANRNLVANFTPILYLISTFVNPSGSGYTTGDGNYSYGEVATIEAFPFPLWEFRYWTENGNIVWTYPSYSFTVTQSRDLTANFEFVDQITEIEGINNIRISPNPCPPCKTKISFTSAHRTLLKIELYDVKGLLIDKILDQEIQSQRFEKEIDTSSLPGGMYFIKITNRNGNMILKLIVL